jgi:membrane-bound lytic murein transglycosylase B
VTSPPAAPDLPRLPPLDPAALDGLVDEVVAAETAIRSATTPAADLPRLAQRAQAIYRMLSARTDLLPRALERVSPALRSVVDANVTAGAELRALTKPKSQLPPWRIVSPPPAVELRRHYAEAEGRFGIPWPYLASIHLVETRMGRIRGTSSAGAQGPMQFLPSTWARYGEGGDINDPRDSILAAGRYLEAAGAPGDMARALYAYNHSQRYVRAVTLYAEQMRADERTYAGYFHWQVYYITPSGDVLLPEGYGG